MKKLAVLLLFFVSCATQDKQPIVMPQWTSIPPSVLDSLCARLQMDAIATGSPLALVSTTRPLATPQSLSALALTTRGRVRAASGAQAAMEMNRPLPVTSEGTTCRWRAIQPTQVEALNDELVVELSAPSLHPYDPKLGGLFARVTVGGQGASWYWVTLVPSNGQWFVGPVYVLVV